MSRVLTLFLQWHKRRVCPPISFSVVQIKRYYFYSKTKSLSRSPAAAKGCCQFITTHHGPRHCSTVKKMFLFLLLSARLSIFCHISGGYYYYSLSQSVSHKVRGRRRRTVEYIKIDRILLRRGCSEWEEKSFLFWFPGNDRARSIITRADNLDSLHTLHAQRRRSRESFVSGRRKGN